MTDSIFSIPILPTELITEILLRVPVKSLLQFRSVSKSWLDLISSPEFIKSHLNLSANNKDNAHHRLILSYLSKYNFKDCSLRSLLYESESDVMKASDLNYPMKNPQKSFDSMNSVNGLICLADGSKDLLIWNPSIRKYKKLPDSKTNSMDVRYFTHGFGYNEFHDDYKAVRLTYYHGHSRDVGVQIYSLKSDSWRSINFLQNGVSIYRSGKFFNGKLYWVNNSDSDRIIMYIDLVDEKWEKVEQPPYGKGDYEMQLGLLGSDLSVYINNEVQYVSLWVMKKSWTKIFTINYVDSPSSYALPFFMSNKGEIVVGFPSIFMIYNPKDGSLNPVIINPGEWRYAEVYVESLVSPFST